MLRKTSLLKVTVWAVGFVLLATSTSEAQRRRGRRGFSRGGFGSGVSILNNEYLQKELNFTAAQKKRVREIIIQLEGTRALLRDDIAQDIGLSDTQKEKIQEARRSAYDRDAIRNLFRNRQRGERPDFEEIRKKMRELREKADKQVLDVLTPPQRKKWEQMKGDPIDREKLLPRRGRRRGRGDGDRPSRKTRRPDV